MANLTEEESWTDDLYRIETTDPVEGGESGIDNLQAKQLGRRTRALRGFIDGAFAPTWAAGVPDYSSIALPAVREVPIVGEGSGSTTFWLSSIVAMTNTAVAQNVDGEVTTVTNRPTGGAVSMVHSNDVVSWAETHDRAVGAVGASHEVKSGLGAAGYAAGVFRVGLPVGGDTLGSKFVVELGSVVGGVTDPLSVEANGLTVLQVRQSATGVSRVSSPRALVIESGPSPTEGYNGGANHFLAVRAPNTNFALGGAIIFDPGAPVANVSDPIAFEVNGTRLLSWNQNAAGSSRFRTGTDSQGFTIGGSSGAAGNNLTIVPNAYTTLGASVGYLMLSAGINATMFQSYAQMIEGPGLRERVNKIKNTTLTIATSGNIDVYAPPDQTTFMLEGDTEWQNTTDTTGGVARITTPGVYRRNGASITTLTAAVVTIIGQDASESGNVTIAVAVSGAEVHFTYVTANAKNRKFSGKLRASASPA